MRNLLLLCLFASFIYACTPADSTGTTDATDTETTDATTDASETPASTVTFEGERVDWYKQMIEN